MKAASCGKVDLDGIFSTSGWSLKVNIWMKSYFNACALMAQEHLQQSDNLGGKCKRGNYMCPFT